MNRNNSFLDNDKKIWQIGLCLVLVLILVALLFYSHIHDQQREKELNILYQCERDKQLAQIEAENEVQIELQEKREKDSFYQKLRDGFDVNILVVGDSIGAGAGASDKNNKWWALLENDIYEKYGCSTYLTNV